MGELRYRLYRNPIVMFGLGPAFIFLLQHRLPFGHMTGWRYWLSAMGTNAGILVLAGGAIYFTGLTPFLLVHIPIILLASTIGVWMFYIQHQFEDTVWASEPTWQFHDAALFGSSYYDLPPVLRWFSANIGIHHVHHLYSKIPFYKLPRVLKDYPELKNVHRLTMLQSLKCLKFRLWDDERQRLVSFREARAHRQRMAATAA